MRKPPEKRSWTPPEVVTLPPLTELTLLTGPLALSDRDRPQAGLFSFIRKG